PAAAAPEPQAEPSRPSKSTWTAEPASPLGAAETTLPTFAPRPVLSAVDASGQEGGPEPLDFSAGPAAPPAGIGARPGAPGGWAGGRAGPTRRRRLAPLLGIAAAVIALVAGGGAYLYVQKSSPANAADADRTSKGHKHAAAAPEHVISITPADGARGVNGAADIRVDFSAPLSAASPMPSIKPLIAGTWQRQGASVVFVPARGYK